MKITDDHRLEDYLNEQEMLLRSYNLGLSEHHLAVKHFFLELFQLGALTDGDMKEKIAEDSFSIDKLRQYIRLNAVPYSAYDTISANYPDLRNDLVDTLVRKYKSLDNAKLRTSEIIKDLYKSILRKSD